MKNNNLSSDNSNLNSSESYSQESFLSEDINNNKEYKTFFLESEKLKKIEQKSKILKKQKQDLLKVKEIIERKKKESFIKYGKLNNNNLDFQSKIVIKNISKNEDFLIFKDRDLDTKVPLNLFNHEEMKILEEFKKFIIRKIIRKYNKETLFDNDIDINKERNYNLIRKKRNSSKSDISSRSYNSCKKIKKENNCEVNNKNNDINTTFQDNNSNKLKNEMNCKIGKLNNIDKNETIEIKDTTQKNYINNIHQENRTEYTKNTPIYLPPLPKGNEFDEPLNNKLNINE